VRAKAFDLQPARVQRLADLVVQQASDARSLPVLGLEQLRRQTLEPAHVPSLVALARFAGIQLAHRVSPAAQCEPTGRDHGQARAEDQVVELERFPGSQRIRDAFGRVVLHETQRPEHDDQNREHTIPRCAFACRGRLLAIRGLRVAHGASSFGGSPRLATRSNNAARLSTPSLRETRAR
jgi:hypothetical protein